MLRCVPVFDINIYNLHVQVNEIICFLLTLSYFSYLCNMKKVYKAHILYTKERSRFEVLEDGYVAVGDDRQLAHRFCRGKEIVL